MTALESIVKLNNPAVSAVTTGGRNVNPSGQSTGTPRDLTSSDKISFSAKLVDVVERWLLERNLIGTSSLPALEEKLLPTDSIQVNLAALLLSSSSGIDELSLKPVASDQLTDSIAANPHITKKKPLEENADWRWCPGFPEFSWTAMRGLKASLVSSDQSISNEEPAQSTIFDADWQGGSLLYLVMKGYRTMSARIWASSDAARSGVSYIDPLFLLFNPKPESEESLN
ncbi:hypothetical protein A3J90_04015 [candidate division WOR-1 bacterium RIFOXYC2_FULL_37_10]|uniref:Uncharacterized protein n=1 Tax=candidate division WOR-1 bacterium RIFOXYB2_FULL_37_13 TaxID=1802579 RepID=A0A1F4SHC1_UNCSA|nr:MAG: hypothetical protein A2246_06575 [candidate division WOR-1 bacterium RIFOXYA2_FULL_37_7]OGC19842.1 MAG: hypothetical protein A2310_05760 [candidate division WOR-1 bacterium RIFOXYB2_FULL_37_13]OGC32935.1 MAG: hypothetical protein A3J90_04015 [candidate division WOR-1 bacterium RIFOXYC2_FULL_37_10]